MTARISVIIPTFNEERRIETAIRTVAAYFAHAGTDYEVVVADDGSSDHTAVVVRRLRDEGFPVRFLTARAHRGKGAAVRRGVMASREDFVLVTDADLSTPMEELDNLFEHIGNGGDIAIGSRGLSDSRLVVRQPAYREWSGRIFNLLVRMLLLRGIWDTQCGFKLLRGSTARELFQHCTIDGFAYDVEVLALAIKAGVRVAEVPVSWAHNAESKVSVGRDAVGMFIDLCRIAMRMRTGTAGSPEHAAVGESEVSPGS